MQKTADWSDFVAGFTKAWQAGRQIAPPTARPNDTTGSGPKVVICSPHPDDESDCGGLALRLRRQQDAQVVNIAMTLGREKERQTARKDEMSAACAILGFTWQLAAEPAAWTDLHLSKAQEAPEKWQAKIDIMTTHFSRLQPDYIIFPHADDQHPTHIGVHHLALAAARQHSRTINKKIIIAETECWRPLADPNLLLGLDQATVTQLVTALSAHQGEMARMPYNLFYPARLMNNVWRGSELVAGFGARNADFLFAELYRVSILTNGILQRVEEGMIADPKGELRIKS